MITWQEVADKSAILGSAPTYSATNEFNYGGALTGTSRSNWFEGISEFTASETFDNDPLLNEPPLISELSEGEFRRSQTFGVDFSYTGAGGNTTVAYQAITAIAVEGGYEQVPTAAGTSSYLQTNSDWSRQTVTLNTYELTTISNITGRTTTESSSVKTYPTTSQNTASSTVSAQSQTAISYSTTRSTASTRATWQSRTYQTTFATGQTVVEKYSSFSHGIPLVLSNSTSATTSESGNKTYSFFELNGYDPEASVSIPSAIYTLAGIPPGISTSEIIYSVTTRSSGSAVVLTGSQGPQITLSGGDDFRVVGTTVSDRFVDNATTGSWVTSTTQATTTTGTTNLEYAETTHKVTVSSSATFTVAAGDFFSSYSDQFITEGLSRTGFYQINEASTFTTNNVAQVADIARRISVGVRVDSAEGPAGNVESEGWSNIYYRHSANIYLAGYSRNATATWSKDSYTFRPTSGESSTGVYGAGAESSATQWMQSETTSRFNTLTGAVTLAGGKIEGNLLVHDGVYRTFNSETDGISSVTSPFVVSWESEAATTGWMKESFSITGGTGCLLNLSRHPITTIIDE
jgi:hypothetical protein